MKRLWKGKNQGYGGSTGLLSSLLLTVSLLTHMSILPSSRLAGVPQFCREITYKWLTFILNANKFCSNRKRAGAFPNFLACHCLKSSKRNLFPGSRLVRKDALHWSWVVLIPAGSISGKMQYGDFPLTTATCVLKASSLLVKKHQTYRNSRVDYVYCLGWDSRLYIKVS